MLAQTGPEPPPIVPRPVPAHLLLRVPSDVQIAQEVERRRAVELWAAVLAPMAGTDTDGWWRAACRGNDPRTFYRHANPAGPALAVCSGCRVTTTCLGAALLEEATTSVAPSGVRGGVTATSRRRLLVRGRAAGLRTAQDWQELAAAVLNQSSAGPQRTVIRVDGR